MKTGFLDFATLGAASLDTTGAKAKLPNVEFWDTSTPAQLEQRLTGLEVAVVNKIRLDDALFAKAPHLKLVCLAATGTDNIDLEAAGKRGIAVCNIRDYCTPAVAQHVFALILELNQHLGEYRERVAHGDWSQSDSFCLLDPPISELSGKTLGLIGLGTLGSAVAGIARAFNMRVIAAQLPWRSTAAPGNRGQSAPRLPLHQLLQQADIVSLHCPLTEDTQHIIDRNALEQMKRDALVINTARGGLVDYAALVEMLQAQEIGGAGIDVLELEPPPADHPLLQVQLPNLIVTPHIAWSARESRQRALDEIVRNILAFQRGEARNRVA